MEGKCLFCESGIGNVDGSVPLWCSMDCKKSFYIKYFAGNVDVRIWEKEFNENFKRRQEKVMKEIRESGLTFTEFFKSLGDFKEDKTAQ